MNTRDLLNRMAEAEEHFLAGRFIAPLLRDGEVRVRVAGIVCRLAVTSRDYEGWAVLQALDHSRARVVKPARLSQIKEYLELFPLVQLILCEKRGDAWFGLPADDGGRLRIEGAVPVPLAREVQLFDAVRTRYDGTRFLFESKNPRRDPAVAAYLRASLAEDRKPEELSRPTLNRWERTAYAWQVRLREQQLRDGTEERLRRAVSHADGRFRSFLERADGYAVTFLVDGESHTASIRKDDLSVMSAGICLSGEDEKFDLTSLVGVIREGQDGRIYRLPD